MADMNPGNAQEDAQDGGADDAQETDANAGGDITALAKTAGEALAKFADAVNNSDGTTEDDKKQMSDVLNGFIDLVENKLGGQAPGQDAQPESKPEMPLMSAMGGAKGVPMSNQYK